MNIRRQPMLKFDGFVLRDIKTQYDIQVSAEKAYHVVLKNELRVHYFSISFRRLESPLYVLIPVKH